MQLGLILMGLNAEQVAQIAAQFGANVTAIATPAPAAIPGAMPAPAAMPGAPAAVPAPAPAPQPAPAPTPAPAPAPVTPPAAQGKSAQVLSAMNTYGQTHGLEGCKTVLGRLGLQRLQDAQDGQLDWLLAVFSNPAITPAQAAAS